MAKSAKPPKPPHNGGGSYPPPPPAPTGLVAIAMSPTSVQLRWNLVENATAYWIRRKDPDGKEYVPAIVDSRNTYTDNSVKSGLTYVYAVAAVRDSVLGPDSEPAIVTMP